MESYPEDTIAVALNQIAKDMPTRSELLMAILANGILANPAYIGMSDWEVAVKSKNILGNMQSV